MPTPTTSQNISTTSHHHPPPAKIYLPPPTTTRHQPRYIHQHPPTPTNSQNLFYKKPIYKNLYPLSGGNVKNLNIKPAIALSFLFTTYTKNGFKKLQCERTFILYETSLALKKDKCLSVENILKEIIELITSINSLTLS